MKDIEKIQSPDLGCQIQDANPGNFAIEQEVGAMVGATVPAPTAPSADDARELGAQLLVFLRRALLPIKSALRTALADIYDHLDSRCTDYTPAAYAPYIPRSYDPMTTPRVPRTVANLLTALTAFAARKISNGSAPNDGIPDGVSLAHLIGETATQSAVTEIKDDNHGWKFNGQLSRLCNLFPNATKLTLNCKEVEVSASGWTDNCSQITDIDMPEVELIYQKTWVGYNQYGFTNLSAERVTIPKLKEFKSDGYGRLYAVDSHLKYLDIPEFEKLTVVYGRAVVYDCSELLELYAPKYQGDNVTGQFAGSIVNCPKIQKAVIGEASVFTVSGSHPDFIYLQLAMEQTKSLNISTWAPTLTEANTATFLQNFLEHICQRLANRTGQTKLTLTLSASVYTAIMTDKDIKAELVARNWKVTDGTNNYNN